MNEKIENYFINSKITIGDVNYYDIHLLNENIDIHIRTKKIDDMGWHELCVDACESSGSYSDKLRFIVFRSTFKVYPDNAVYELPSDYLMSIIKSILAIHRVSKDSINPKSNLFVKQPKVKYEIFTEKSNNTFIVPKNISKSHAPLFFGGLIDPEGCKWDNRLPCTVTEPKKKEVLHDFIDLHGEIGSPDYTQQVVDFLYKDKKYNIDEVLEAEYNKAEKRIRGLSD